MGRIRNSPASTQFAQDNRVGVHPNAGPAAGVVAGRHRGRAEAQQAQQAVQQQSQAQAHATEVQMNAFKNGFSACLEGKQYIAKF
jgi:hypothetical protein